MRKSKGNNGFTLIEMLVYVSLIAVVFTLFNGFVKNIVISSISATSEKELYQNNRLILNKISLSIKSARSVSIGTPPDNLDLVDPGNNNIRFYLDGSEMSVHYVEDGEDIAISNDAVKVTQLSFVRYGNIVGVNLSLEEKKPKDPDNIKNINSSAMVALRNNIY